MGLSFQCTKNLVERIEAQNKNGYKINRKPRKKPVLPVNEKPVVPEQVVDKVPRKEKPPQIETAVQKDPTDQKELKLEKKIEQKKHTQKMTKTNSHISNKNKTNKEIGRKEGAQHKCIFSYTNQVWPDGATKVKAKKSVKKGQVLFEDEYNILYGNENPELFCKWVSFLEERHIKDPANPSKVDWTLMEIVAGEAKEVVKATLLQLHPAKVGYTVATLPFF